MLKMSSGISCPVNLSWLSSFIQLLRFVLVGGMNTMIDIVAFNILAWAWPTHNLSSLVLYNSLAYFIGSVNSFFWNKIWTFEQHTKVTRRQVVRFIMVTALGIVCNDVFLWLTATFLASLSLTGFLWTNVGKVCAVAGSVTISYLGMRLSVFTKNERDTTPLPPPAEAYVFTEPKSLSIVLPAYNEEALIGHTITNIMFTLTKWTHNFEVIVVNDGSKDHTAEVVTALSNFDKRIRLINHTVNKGYGAALVTGFAAVTKELIFFMDADGQFDIRDLARFFPLIEEYGAVLGYRLKRQDTWVRKLNAWVWKQLVGFIFGVRVRDVDCAFKLFRAEFFRTHQLETRGAMINTEIIYKLCRAGYIYTEVGVQHLPRRAGKATGAKPAVILLALLEMLTFAEKWRMEELFKQLHKVKAAGNTFHDDQPRAHQGGSSLHYTATQGSRSVNAESSPS